MHELSLVHSICDAVAGHVHPAQRVKKIVVECGPLVGVVPEALDYCFSLVAPSAGLTGAVLELRLLEAPAVCSSCRAKTVVKQAWAECPRCGYEPLTVRGGRDLLLKEIEVESPS